MRGLEASLRRDRRRLAEALALLDGALAIDRWGETPALLLGRSKALEELGDFAGSIATLRHAAARIDGEREPRKLLVAHHNLAANLCHLRAARGGRGTPARGAGARPAGGRCGPPCTTQPRGGAGWTGRPASPLRRIRPSPPPRAGFSEWTSGRRPESRRLVLLEDPLVCANTTASDFRGTDLIAGERPVSVYLTVAPSDLDRMRPLLRIVLNQITRQLTRTIRPGRRPVLLMLDEFTALGKLDFMHGGIGFFRGYQIRVFISIQSLEQLYQIYGQHQSIGANCGVQIAYGAYDVTTAKLLSEMTGRRTVEYPPREPQRRYPRRPAERKPNRGGTAAALAR